MNWYRLIKTALALQNGPYGYWLGPSGEVISVKQNFAHKNVAEQYLTQQGQAVQGDPNQGMFSIGFARVSGPTGGMLDVEKPSRLTDVQFDIIAESFGVLKKMNPRAALFFNDLAPIQDLNSFYMAV